MTPEERRAKQNEYARKSNAKLRLEAISAYGGECACCGENEEAFLVLDHIADDGAEHRRSLGYDRYTTMGTGAGVHTYRALRKEGWPPIVQVLCANCNMAKTRGECPHKAASDKVLAPEASDMIK